MALYLKKEENSNSSSPLHSMSTFVGSAVRMLNASSPMICPMPTIHAVLNNVCSPLVVPCMFVQAAIVTPSRGFLLNVLSSRMMSLDPRRSAKCPQRSLRGRIRAPFSKKALFPIFDWSRTTWFSHFSNPRYITTRRKQYN